MKNYENVVVERRLMKQKTDGILVPQNPSQSLRPEGANLVSTILYFQRIILQTEHLLVSGNLYSLHTISHLSSIGS